MEKVEDTKLRYELDDIIARGLVGDSEFSWQGMKELIEYVKELKD